MRGIFAVDPGGHTGVAWGVVNEHASTAIQAVHNRQLSNSITVEGSPMEQAKDLWVLWSEFRRTCYGAQLSNESVDLVLEDFVLLGGMHAGGRDGTAPERIAYAFEGYRHGRFDTWRKEKHLAPIHWQMPSSAARYRRRQILEDAGAWIKGREHERSAFAHLILRTNIVMNNTRPAPTRRR